MMHIRMIVLWIKSVSKKNEREKKSEHTDTNHNLIVQQNVVKVDDDMATATSIESGVRETTE